MGFALPWQDSGLWKGDRSASSADFLRIGPSVTIHRNMTDAEGAVTASDRLLELVGRLERQEGFAEVVESLQEGHAATLDGVWGSSCALAAAALAAHAPATLVVVCPQIDQVDELIDDLALFTRLRPERFPGLGIARAGRSQRRSLRRAAASC